ncbi:MAG: hypothetical protein DBY36_03735, partial [Clostridiales bacterium]
NAFPASFPHGRQRAYTSLRPCRRFRRARPFPAFSGEKSFDKKTETSSWFLFFYILSAGFMEYRLFFSVFLSNVFSLLLRTPLL